MPSKTPVKVEKIFTSLVEAKSSLPLSESGVSAGFPSPADDYIQETLDLNEHIVKHPAATFFVRVTGESMIHAGIHDRDILVVDRSLSPKNGDIVIALVDNEFTVKIFRQKKNSVFLDAANDNYPPLEMKEGMKLLVWGVVTYVIHPV